MGWQPIETAPKDGTWVLVKGGGAAYWDGATEPPVMVAQYISTNRYSTPGWQMGWFDYGDLGKYYGATHWMPLEVILDNKDK